MAQASYLINFVKSLIENDNKGNLEENKKKLREEYNYNSSSLNNDLGDKYEQVSKILSVYRYISERVKKNREGVAIIKSNLTECKQLLQCNRDDLRRLWLELVEKRHCVKLLDALEEVKLAPELITSLTEEKEWFEATLVALKAQKRICGGLDKVGPILSIRGDLLVRQKTLIDRLKSNVHKMIFDDSLTSALRNSSLFGGGDRRTSERSYGNKNMTIKDIDSETNYSELLENMYDKVPKSFRHIILANNWSSIGIDNCFWSDKAENYDIRSINRIWLTRDKKSNGTSNTSSSSNTSCLNLPQGHFDKILTAIFSLYEVNKLQEMINEWVINTSTNAANSTAESTAQTSNVVEDRMEYIRREIFKLIIVKAIEQIKRSAMSQNDTRLENFEDHRYLLELLDLIYYSLFLCQSSLLLMHKTVKYLMNCKKINLSLGKFEDIDLTFDGDAIRNVIQNEIIALLEAHLKISKKRGGMRHDTNYGLSSSQNGNSLNIPNGDILRYYMCKKKGLLTGVTTSIPSNIQVVAYSTGANQQSIQLSSSPVTYNSNIWDYNNTNAPDTAVATIGNTATNSPNQKPTLFKFANSSHSLSVNACLQEMRPLTYNMDELDTSGPNIKSESYPVVCKPHHNNITGIFGSVMEFIEVLEIEDMHTNARETRKPCALRIYINTFIDRVFMKDSGIEMHEKLNGIFKESQSLKGLHNLVSQASEKDLCLQRPIISLMLTADQVLEDLKRVTMTLRHFAVPYLLKSFNILEKFKDNLWQWFRQICESDNAKEPHMSAEWGKDADLIRFWKNMQSWQNMISIDVREYAATNSSSVLPTSPSYLTNTNVFGTDFKTGEPNNRILSISSKTNPSESGCGYNVLTNNQFNLIYRPVETNNKNLLKERQARLLVNEESLHDLRLIEEEILSNVQPGAKLAHNKSKPTTSNKVVPPVFMPFVVFRKNELLKQMARLHESVAWLSHRIIRFQSWLQKKPWELGDENKLGGEENDENDEKEMKDLFKKFALLENDIAHLADACLMTIHLEGRLRAYNYILRLPIEANYSNKLDEVDIDQQVSQLIKSLNDMEFALTHSLTRHKFRFVFEGLGNFMSALFVQILPNINAMSGSGVKKMCKNIYKIQQNLSALTHSHEMDLVRVKNLYELLYLTPETIVTMIMEQGAVYEKEVYREILNIYQRSNPLYNNDKLKAAQVRLNEVINMEYV